MNSCKLLPVGFLTLIGFTMTAGESHAWGLLCGLRDRCNYSTYICCRPYNAFTPVCFGTITCNGCCPIVMQPPYSPGYGGWMPGGYPGMGGCGPNGCAPNFTVGDGPSHGPCVPMYGDPGFSAMPHGVPQAAPHFQAPMPVPAPIQQQSYNVAAAGQSTPPAGYAVPGYYVHPVNYYPMWPNMPVVPSYWYGR